MTAYDVDVDELAAVVAAMDSCGRELAGLAADVEDAHSTSHASWRSSFAEMGTALAGLRSVGDTAQSNYSAAVEVNVAMWEQVR